MNKRLQPCPWCGMPSFKLKEVGPSLYVRTDHPDPGDRVWYIGPAMMARGAGSVFVRCMCCGRRSKDTWELGYFSENMIPDDDLVEEAIAYWNSLPPRFEAENQPCVECTDFNVESQ